MKKTTGQRILHVQVSEATYKKARRIAVDRGLRNPEVVTLAIEALPEPTVNPSQAQANG